MRGAAAGWLAAAALAGAGAVAVAWIVLAEPGVGAGFGPGSPRNPGSDGASVAARLLAAGGVEVVRLTHPVDYARLRTDAAVLRIAPPAPAGDEEGAGEARGGEAGARGPRPGRLEAAFALEWVRRGGRLVLLGAEETEIHRALACAIVAAEGRVEPAQPLPAGLRRIEAGEGLALDPAPGRPAAVLFRRAAAPWLLEVPWGEGVVAAAPASAFLLNEGIDRADHAAILIELVTAGRPAVGFAEYALGIARTAAIGAVLGRFRLGPILACAGLLFALYVWRHAPGFRVPGGAAEIPRREAVELVLGAANLYDRGLSDRALIERALASLRTELGRRTGRAGPALDADLERVLAGAGWTERARRGPLAHAIRPLAACFRRMEDERPRRPA